MESSKYRKRPIIIEAIQWTGNIGTIQHFLKSNQYEHDSTSVNERLIIKTLEGQHIASINDYIIKGIKGEVYPCKPDIFEQTYEKIV